MEENRKTGKNCGLAKVVVMFMLITEAVTAVFWPGPAVAAAGGYGLIKNAQEEFPDRENGTDLYIEAEEGEEEGGDIPVVPGGEGFLDLVFWDDGKLLDQKTISADTLQIDLRVPEKTGYLFQGFASGEFLVLDVSGNVVLPAGEWAPAGQGEREVSLNAVWEPKHYILCYGADDDKDGIPDGRREVVFGETFELLEPMPDHGLSVFKGYYLGRNKITDRKGNAKSSWQWDEGEIIELKPKFYRPDGNDLYGSSGSGEEKTEDEDPPAGEERDKNVVEDGGNGAEGSMEDEKSGETLSASEDEAENPNGGRRSEEAEKDRPALESAEGADLPEQKGDDGIGAAVSAEGVSQESYETAYVEIPDMDLEITDPDGGDAPDGPDGGVAADAAGEGGPVTGAGADAEKGEEAGGSVPEETDAAKKDDPADGGSEDEAQQNGRKKRTLLKKIRELPPQQMVPAMKRFIRITGTFFLASMFLACLIVCLILLRNCAVLYTNVYGGRRKRIAYILLQKTQQGFLCNIRQGDLDKSRTGEYTLCLPGHLVRKYRDENIFLCLPEKNQSELMAKEFSFLAPLP